MRTIGILGGMGPLATAALLQHLVTNTLAERDQDHPPVVVISWPWIPDRTAYILGEGPDPRPAILEGAHVLRKAGADMLVMPCNTANVWLSEIASTAELEPVPWLDLAVAAVAASGARRVGVLATSGTLRADVYGRRLVDAGLAAIVPDKADQVIVMDAIYAAGGVKATGRVHPTLGEGLARVADHLVDAGAEAILLGCTELPFAIEAAQSRVPLIDPAVTAARAALRSAGARVIGEGSGDDGI